MSDATPRSRSVLVTNDDGVDSPALGPLADVLADLGTVRVVVPDGERSWTGKAMTRTGHVHVEEVERDGRRVTTVSGTPADAAQVGCGLLAPGPDLVVSGINLGHNHGSAFALSSGTIGAAVEAVLLGRTAVAVSTGTMEDWDAWRALAGGPGSRGDWARLSEVVHDVLVTVLAAGLPDACDLVSVNLPWDADGDTPWRLTRLATTRYGAMLVPGVDDGPDDGPWSATYGGLEVLDDGDDHPLPTDLEAAHAGLVSVTPLRFPDTAIVPDDVRRRVERH